MGHVNLCVWCQQNEVGFNGSLDFCSYACEQACYESHDNPVDEMTGYTPNPSDDQYEHYGIEFAHEAYMAQFDDDPSPYSDTYSEE